jgi:predicted Zn-dependent peptidase
MQSLREKYGLTYSVYASSIDIENDMLFYIDTEVKAEQTDEALLYVKEELLRLINEKVEEEELSIVKSYMTGSLLRRLDGTIDYAKEFMYWKAANLNEREAVEIFRQIKQINTQQIQELAVSYLQPDSFNTIVVGNTNRSIL